MPASKDVDTTRKLEDTLNGTTTETGEEGAKRPPGGCQQRRNFFAVSNELKSRVFGRASWTVSAPAPWAYAAFAKARSVAAWAVRMSACVVNNIWLAAVGVFGSILGGICSSPGQCGV
jgi:hypothetical protein